MDPAGNLDAHRAVTCEDGNGREVFRQELEYTDFPLPEVQLYCTDNTILQPSEY